ncbi:hypothetical protein BCR32DRAFT_293627 [Anaeromyces robustus]|uniref:chitin synthase n=1 Tax=Anaeromyces robustus TaxID=1754192 RepID=A0A1Y1X594_9FUNG|nr:hypothetical protein BCR32DRAFT_293627 [Anaeromyces robustus]|eukprot:ORX80828.1 hypothetical protein BCR32DRAFT_293627 [Anaeromyces robustus]
MPKSKSEQDKRPVIINAYPNNGSSLPRRNQTLTRPERNTTLRRPLMRTFNRPPPAARAGATSGRTLKRPIDLAPIEDFEEEQTGCWTLTSKIITFWGIRPIRALCGVGKSKEIVQAWREKISLCLIIFLCWCLMGFCTVGIQPLLCPKENYKNKEFNPHLEYKDTEMLLYYDGKWYQNSVINALFKSKNINLEIPDEFRGTNIMPLFRNCKSGSCPSPCSNVFNSDSDLNKCILKARDKTVKLPNGECIPSYIMKDAKPSGVYNKDWKYDIKDSDSTVYDNVVIENFQSKLENSTLKEEYKVLLKRAKGQDGTRYFEINERTREFGQCLKQHYAVAVINTQTYGCFISISFTYILTGTILGVVFARFIMAVIFSWFVSSNLVQPKSKKGIRHLFTICLVTAYSEGEDGIRCTLNSLATTTYPDKKKLLFVIADGIIVGSGNDRSTPDICTSMIIEDPKLGRPEPKSYFAIADGAKQHNMARAHAGYYIVDGHRVPIVVVVKCGTPAEAKGAKPGNRGKRDSQLLLMNFLSRVTFDDRMTPLDYDLFKRIQHICGVTPDKFEIVLMVDADTKVLPTSLSYMIAAMVNDPMIMGLCGETRIANKTTSWVTWIQVFEYYISHHLGKCFESLFGGVTCLPGCFCMYRIKAPKPGIPNTYVPILANPDIVEDYSENVVDTLHKKNLLLLGEDRFLTTLMLRTFPKRKMIFVPQALCKTIVPDEFKVLLSQRRRWINSTVHNLMELVLVRDLCGTFCFSMQFVVFMELFGTAVLPAAIIFTVYLIVLFYFVVKESVGEKDQVKYILNNGPILPLIMLFAVLGLPGILVMLTTQKIVYILWMIIYLLGLPVWNLVLPVYAFWHFDDFSWGETRKVEGDNGDDHSKKEGVFNSSSVPLKRWHEYEKENRTRQGSSPYIGGSQNSRHSPMGRPMGGSMPRPPQGSTGPRSQGYLGPRPQGSLPRPPQGSLGPRPQGSLPRPPQGSMGHQQGSTGPRSQGYLGPRPGPMALRPQQGSMGSRSQGSLGPRPNGGSMMSPQGPRPLGPRPISVGPRPNQRPQYIPPQSRSRY